MTSRNSMEVGAAVIRIPERVVAGFAAAFALAMVGCGRETVIAVTSSDGRAITAPPTDGSAPPSDRAAPAAPGYHTQGARIVDDANKVVHIRGISWFGLETNAFAPHGLWARSMTSLLDQIASLGFNTLRIPWSSQLLDPDSKPNGFDPSTYNPDLAGLDGPSIMDKLVAGATARGLYVILDHHRPSAGSDSPLWHDSKYDEARWIDDWKRMAARYASVPAFVGCDLESDLRDPATWGDGNPDTDWLAAAERAGNAILAVNPRLLVIVEGVERAAGGVYWRGGNLRGARAKPVVLSLSGKVVYATEDFPASVGDQPSGGATWLTDAAFPANLPGVWDQNWGYLVENDTAPVLVAAFGTEYATDADKAWLSTFTAYIARRELGFAYWSLNPNSTYTGGVLASDWQNPRADLLAALAPVLP